MAREIIRSDDLWTPKQPFSYGTVVKGGTLIFLAGAMPLDKEGNLVGKGDMKAQIRQTVENIKIALKEAGATLSDIVNMRTFVTSIDEYLKTPEWRCQNFPELWGSTPSGWDAPSGTLVEIPRLAVKDQMVEIEAFAHVK